MASESVINLIVKSLSFEIQATPHEDENIKTTNTSNITPLNVKIRVKKKHESNVQNALVAVPKFGNPYGPSERIRLISSEQTIMSFNVLMETDYVKKKKKRSRKYLFGGCLGMQYDDDDSPYLPSSTYREKSVDQNVISKSEAVIKENLTLPKNQHEHFNSVPPLKNHTVLGKCKPGGCLDPPFSEDRYSYKPANKNTIFVKSTHKTETKKKSSKSIGIPKNNFSICSELCKKKDDSVLYLYETNGLHDSIDIKYSDSIITYPPELTSSININENVLRSKICNDRKQRGSIIEGSEVFYSPAKSYRREESYEKQMPDKIFSENSNKEVLNSQTLKLETDKTDTEIAKLNCTDTFTQEFQHLMPNHPLKMINKTSVDSILQEDIKDSDNISNNQNSEVKTDFMSKNIDQDCITFLSTCNSLKNNEKISLNDSFHEFALEDDKLYKNKCTLDAKLTNYFNKSDIVERKRSKSSASASIRENYVTERKSQKIPIPSGLKKFDNYISTSKDSVSKNETKSLKKPVLVTTGEDKFSEKIIIDDKATEDNLFNNQNNDSKKQIRLERSLHKNLAVKKLNSYEIKQTKEEHEHKSSHNFVNINKDLDELKSKTGSTTPSNKEFDLSNISLQSFCSDELKQFNFHKFIINENNSINTIIPIKDSTITTNSENKLNEKSDIGVKNDILDEIYYDKLSIKSEKYSQPYSVSKLLVTNELDINDLNKVEKRSYTTINQEKTILSSEINNTDKNYILKTQPIEQVISSNLILTHVENSIKNASILSEGSESVDSNKTYKFKEKNSNNTNSTDPFNKIIDNTEIRHVDPGRRCEQTDNGKTETAVKMSIELEQLPEIKINQKPTSEFKSSSTDNNYIFNKIFHRHNSTKPEILPIDSNKIITTTNNKGNTESFQKQSFENVLSYYDNRHASGVDSSFYLKIKNESISANQEFKEHKDSKFENNRKTEMVVKIPTKLLPEIKNIQKTTSEHKSSSSDNNIIIDKTFHEHNSPKPYILSNDSDIKSKSPMDVKSGIENFQKLTTLNVLPHYDNRYASREDGSFNLNTENDSISANKEFEEYKDSRFEDIGKTETVVKISIELEQLPEITKNQKPINGHKSSSPDNNNIFDKIFNHTNSTKSNVLSNDSDNESKSPINIIGNIENFQKQTSRNMLSHYDNKSASREDHSFNFDRENDKEFEEYKNSRFENIGKRETIIEQLPEIKKIHKPTNEQKISSPDNDKNIYDKAFHRHIGTKPNILSTDSDIASELPRNVLNNTESLQKSVLPNIFTNNNNKSASHEDIISNSNAGDDESYSELIRFKELFHKSSERQEDCLTEHPDYKSSDGIQKETVSLKDPILRSSNINNKILLEEKISDTVKVLEESINNTIVNKDKNEKWTAKYETSLSLHNEDSDLTPGSPKYENMDNTSKKYHIYTGENGSPRIDDIFSEQSTSKISESKVPLQNSNNNTHATTSLADIHLKSSTSKASFISIDKFYGNLSTSFTEEYHSSKLIKDSIGSRESTLKNEVITLNVGFKSYTNTKNERFIETVDTSNITPQRINNDIITHIKAQIHPYVNDIRIPIDSENEMSIHIQRCIRPLQVQRQSIGQQNKKKEPSLKSLKKIDPNLTNKEIEELFDLVYERDLIPLQKAFKHLKQDVAILADQQLKYKVRPTGPKRSKSIRVVKMNPKCCCWKK